MDDQPEDLPEGPPDATPSRAMAYLFEIGLGLLAIFIGYCLQFSPARTLGFDSLRHAAEQIAWGVVATLPMLGMFFALQASKAGWVERLKELVDELLTPLFRGAHAIELALLSLAAGLGEELLFRGLLQDGLAAAIGGPTGVVIGLVIASLAFGVCHWISNTYLILATIIGVYFGVLFLVFDHLAVPIVAHALYDFIALCYLLRDDDAKRAAGA